MPHRESLNADRQALAPLYALLGRLALLELDQATVAVLSQPEIHALFTEADPEFSVSFTEDTSENSSENTARPWSDTEIEAAATEFCTLFILPGAASPRASAWIEGEIEVSGARLEGFLTEVTAALGIVAEGPLAAVPKDHLAFLLQLMAQALGDQGDPAIAEALLRRALRPWVQNWANATASRATLPVYRAHARLVADLVGAA